MRRSLAFYMLPGQGKMPPHKSATKLSARDAAALGALYPIPGTTEYREEPDADEEKPPKPFDSGGGGSAARGQLAGVKST